jgi:hypothetical protein
MGEGACSSEHYISNYLSLGRYVYLSQLLGQFVQFSSLLAGVQFKSAELDAHLKWHMNSELLSVRWNMSPSADIGWGAALVLGSLPAGALSSPKLR